MQMKERIAEMHTTRRFAASPAPDPDLMPNTPPPRHPLPPGKQPYGPMPDQDPGDPKPRLLPDEDPLAPEDGDARMQQHVMKRQALDSAALMARIR